MSTRGPQRWCPRCHGQIYYHHSEMDTQLQVTFSAIAGTVPAPGDWWYCQGCGECWPEKKTLKSGEPLAAQDGENKSETKGEEPEPNLTRHSPKRR